MDLTLTPDNEFEEIEQDVQKYLPENINFGFTDGINKQSYKDTLTLINNYVKENFKSKRASFFKVTKVKDHEMLPDGYFYEIQEGGYGVSFSEYLIDEFRKEESNSVLLKIKDRYAFIIRKIDGVETNYTSTNEISEKQKEKLIHIDYTDFVSKTQKPNMERVFQDKFVFFIVSQVSLISALLVLGFASFLKFSYFDMNQELENTVDYSNMPIEEIWNLESTENKRVKSVQYKADEWFVMYEVNQGGDFIEESEVIGQALPLKEQEIMRSEEGGRE